MKAVVCKAMTGPQALAFEEVEAPRPGESQVRVAVHAASINFFDILMVQGLYQVKPETPFVPGSEAAGEVLEVGAKVTSVKPGDRVMAGAQTGAFAEEMVCDDGSLFALPDAVDYRAAAALRAVYGTSYYALRDRARLKAGETLLVHGAAGGVGLAAVELGTLMGARVIGTVGADAKMAVVKEYGAEEVFNYQSQDIRDTVKALTGGQGADVIYDPVGGDVFDASVRCINWGGRLLVIGFTSGRIPELRANLALLKSFDLVGVFWGSWTMREPEAARALMEELIGWVAEGKIKPHIGASYPLANVAEAMKSLTERKATGKVILDVR